jgi:hypothetical protein
MTNECRNRKPKNTINVPFRYSSFVINSSFVIRASSFAARLTVSSRLELRRALSFSHGAGDGNIIQLTAIHGTTQEQSAPAHVAAADKIRRETEPRAEMLEKDIGVFGRGDAAEENDLAIGRQFFCEPLHVALERRAVTRVVFMNVDLGKLEKICETDRRERRDEAACRGDDKDRRPPSSRRRKGIRVSEFSPEVEAAQESENLSEGWWLVAPKAARQIELRPFAHHHAGTLPAGVSRRKKKDARH